MPFDPAKLAAVRRYLARHFQALERYDFEKADGQGHVFRVYRPERDLDFLAVLSAGFLDQHTPEEIAELLERWELADLMRQEGRQEVLVTRVGAELTDRQEA